MTRLAIAALLAACGTDSGDVVGPFTGASHRFVVDRVSLPITTFETTSFGDDLDGDGMVDNQLGVIFAALSETHDATTHGADMVASGRLASVVTIQADSLDDGIAGVSYEGDAGAAVTAMGGRFVGGVFASNRSATTHAPGAGTVALPVFADADPLLLPVTGMEIDLAATNAGGYDGTVRGGIPIDDARTIAYAGVAQMMVDNPSAHLVFARIIDADHDGTITTDEVSNSSLLAAFLIADLHGTLSVGFSIHLAACAAGECIAGPPNEPCFDRVRDGAETDVDCGGGCAPCPAAAACGVPADCQSAACDAGHCRAPSCSDGVRDGFESDVDCGAACPKCAAGQTCANGTDCISGSCSGAIASTGTCTM